MTNTPRLVQAEKRYPWIFFPAMIEVVQSVEGKLSGATRGQSKK